MPYYFRQYPYQEIVSARNGQSVIAAPNSKADDRSDDLISHLYSWPRVAEEFYSSFFESPSYLLDRLEMGFDLPIQSFQSTNSGYRQTGP